MTVVIDRIEGDMAVVEMENGQTADMPALLLPTGAKEGDVVAITIDRARKKDREARIDGLLNNLWKDV